MGKFCLRQNEKRDPA